jgi:hypothetical protein
MLKRRKEMNKFINIIFPKNEKDPLNDVTRFKINWGETNINFNCADRFDLTTNEGIKEMKEIFHQIIDMLIDEIVKGEKK